MSNDLALGFAFGFACGFAFGFAVAFAFGIAPSSPSVDDFAFAFAFDFPFAFGLPLTGSVEDPGKPPGGSSGFHVLRSGERFVNRPW